MKYVLKESTAMRLAELVRDADQPDPPIPVQRKVTTWNPVLVRALDDTAVGGSAEGDQCYDAEVLLINSLVADQTTGAAVWLTVLSEKDTAAAPTVDAIYSCLYAGRFDPDPGGAGTDSRPRVFAVPVGSSSSLVWDWVQLSSDYDPVTTVKSDTGLQISIPSAGTYEIFGSWSSQATVSTGPGFANIAGQLYDTTAAAYVSDVFAGACPRVLNLLFGVTAPLSWVITFAAATTLKLRAFTDPLQTYTVAKVPAEGTSIGYRKLA